MITAFCMCAALMLAAIAHSSPAGAQGAPPAGNVYAKPGAGHEEFQRTSARCRMNAGMAADVFNDPVRWLSVYRDCMRADGWVLVRKR